MSVTNVSRDLDSLQLTVTAVFEAPVETTWQLWADPRKLERWWGPPTYPATVTAHDLSVGGGVTYVMTGPEGDAHGGWWRVIDVEPPRRLVVEDGFLGPDGEPNPSMPTVTMTTTLREQDGGTVATVVIAFSSLEAMQQLLEMGMDEGMRAAMEQMDSLLT